MGSKALLAEAMAIALLSARINALNVNDFVWGPAFFKGSITLITAYKILRDPFALTAILTLYCNRELN